MAPETLVLDAKLGRPQLKKLFAGMFGIATLVLAARGVKVDKLSEDEADALAEPAARILHGRKKIQAAIERATDPGLLAAAALTIIETRLSRSRGVSSPAPAARQAPQPTQQPAAAAAPRPAAPAAPQNVVEPPHLDPAGVDAVLDEMFAGIVAHG